MTSRRSGGLRAREQRGYVLVLTSICLLAFTMLIGFAVDLGSWYLRASKLQRASDAAALAGAVSLPDASAASAAAMTTFNHNGLFDGQSSITLTTTITGDGKVSATAKDSAVPTYFIRMIMSKITIARSSIASRTSVVPLGSPYNVFGTGTLNLAGSNGVPKQNFWAAVNGPCTSKEDGDYFLAKWDGNAPPGGRHYCPHSETNPNYNKLGYIYAVDIPAAYSGAVDIEAWDPVFSWGYTEGGQRSKDLSDIAPQDEDGGDMDTMFVVWNTNGSSKQTDWTTVGTPRLYHDGGNAGEGVWDTLYTVPANSGAARDRNYRVQVYSTESTEPGVTVNSGVNTFGLLARRASDANPANGATPVACDTRKDATCPQVYGISAVSTYNTLVGGAGAVSTYFLADLDPSFAGSSITVYLWDPGEGTRSMELLAPDNTPMDFTWTSTGNGAAFSSASPTKLLDVSGNGTQLPTRHGTGRFNDRLLTITLPIPPDYASHLGPNNDGWWKLRYTANTSGSTDRITWGVNAGGSGVSPSHLTTGGS